MIGNPVRPIIVLVLVQASLALAPAARADEKEWILSLQPGFAWLKAGDRDAWGGGGDVYRGYVAKIVHELGRRYGGEEEAYRIALEDDDQVKSAAALFDKAPTLPKLLALASEISKGKQQTNLLNNKPVR